MKRTALRVVLGLITALLGVGLVAGPASATTHAPTKRGTTFVTLDAGAAAALTSLGVSVAPTFPARAKADAQGRVVAGFPVTAATSKKIKHVGGLYLYSHKAGIVLSRYTIDLTKGTVAGTVNYRGKQVDLFTIDAATTDPTGGVGLRLTAGAASALNSTFGVSAFTEGLLLGYANPNVKA